MKKMNRTPLVAVMGAAFLSTFAATAVNAEANPFGMTEMSAGYMQIAAADKAAEMACGAAMGGMTKPKGAEGACAGHKKPDAAKTTEGKCGESKCGAMMQDGKMKPGMEAACGAMMKGKEGACGDKMKMPAAPAVPATPATPATPAVPETPATPATPAVPETPATPATPAVPATPATPAE